MLTTIIFCLMLAIGIWASAIIILQMIYREAIYWWHFVVFSISWTAVITYCINIW